MAKVWTAQEEAYLYENYNDMTNTQLGGLFGVTPKAISHKMRRLRDRARRAAEKRERLRREEEEKKAIEEVVEEEYFEEEICEPLDLPCIRPFEKKIDVDGQAIKLFSTGFYVKTEAGWSPVMMRKHRLYD